MKAPSLAVSELDPELEAALLGNFPALERGSADAQRFAKAFGPTVGPAWWENETPAGPLGLAAQAVALERSERLDQSTAMHREQASQPGWVGLLGLLLLGWGSGEDGDTSIRDAAVIVRRLRRGQRRARLLAKLATFAFDKRSGSLARTLWSEAIESSTAGSRLERALQIEAMNLGLGLEDRTILSRSEAAPDDLVDLPWIYDLRLQAASGTLSETVDDRALGTWGYTIRMGSTRVGEIIAAEIQTTWVGALWTRRAVRKQLGAQLLAGAAETPDEWAYAVTMWTLGGARNPRRAFELAEPNLDHRGADSVIKAVGESEDSTNNPQRLVDLAVAAWDELSTGVLRWVVGKVPLMTGQVPPAPESRRIWAAYAIRLTPEWFEEYRKLPPGTQASLLDSLNPGGVEALGSEATAVMYEAAIAESTQRELELNDLLPMIAALSPDDDLDRIRAIVERHASASTVASMLEDQSEFVPEPAVREAEGALVEAVTKQSQDAKSRSQVSGGTSVRVDLGRLLAGCKEPSAQAIKLLVETATDQQLPSDYVLEARQALVLLRRAGQLTAADINALRQAPDGGDHDLEFRGFTTSILRAFRLQALATDATEEERRALVAAARDTDERVRDVAVNACAEALDRFDDDALAWAVVSGLFDPVDSVAAGALAGLKAIQRFPTAAEVAWRRLPELMRGGGRRVRANVVSAALSTRPESASLRRTREAVVNQARHDRSWIVRDAAAAKD